MGKNESIINMLLVLIVGFILTISFMLEEIIITNNSVNVNKYFNAHNVIELEEDDNEEVTVIEKEKEIIIKKEEQVIIEEPKVEIVEDLKGDMSFYTAKCIGCSGFTATGYDINNTIYYNDNTFGKLRVLSGDRSLLGSVIKFNLNNKEEIGIVLDTGSSVGFNKRVMFDLLVETKEEAINLGIKRNLSFEILRKGY